MKEEQIYAQLAATRGYVPEMNATAPGQVDDYRHLVRNDTWRQAWNAETRRFDALHEVSGSIWSDAIACCLRETGSAYIPRMESAIYLDRPIVLESGDRLIVHPQTEIRLKGDVQTSCMIRNAHLVFSPDQPVEMCAGADENILIEGGIWSNQNNPGPGPDSKDAMPGARGAFLLHNVRHITVRNVRLKDCSSFAIQIGNAASFIVEQIHCDDTADGVHVEGPSHGGVIRGFSGKTNDDAVALNAWDWENSSITFGPISDVLIEDIQLIPADTWSELRFLPGTKRFASGETVDCDIDRCVVRNVRGVHTFKLYDQPNCHMPEQDFADPIGKMRDLFFADIEVDGIDKATYYDKSSDGVFDICTDIVGLSIRDVRFNYLPGGNDMAPYLVSVGPKSLTWPRGKSPADGWREIFNANANPVVQELAVSGISCPDVANPESHVPCGSIAALLHERRLTLNPDFPATMPRGGTGAGRILA